jgi:hypothetical protein
MSLFRIPFGKRTLLCKPSFLGTYLTSLAGALIPFLLRLSFFASFFSPIFFLSSSLLASYLLTIYVKGHYRQPTLSQSCIQHLAHCTLPAHYSSIPLPGGSNDPNPLVWLHSVSICNYNWRRKGNVTTVISNHEWCTVVDGNLIYSILNIFNSCLLTPAYLLSYSLFFQIPLKKISKIYLVYLQMQWFIVL